MSTHMAAANSSEYGVVVEDRNSDPEEGSSDFDDSLDEINLENLNENQSRIDTVLRFLLNYNVPKKSVGRPRKNRSTNVNPSSAQSVDGDVPQEIPVELSDSMKKISDIKDLHPGLWMDYLVKLNDFNKKILQTVGVLHKKYSESELKSRQFNPLISARVGGGDIPNLMNEATPTGDGEVDLRRPAKEVQLETRLDAIEQKSNANIVLCSGPSIREIIGNKPENLKEAVISNISNVMPGVMDKGDISRVSPYGKQKTHVKIICSSNQVRRKLIVNARQKRPFGVFLSEFLTNSRNRLFYALRALRNKYREKMSAAYVRDGNIFYKLTGDETFKIVRTQMDITKLEKKLNGSE